MMNINFNLLPMAKKNRLEYIINFLLLKGILEIVIVICSVLTATLIWSWLFLQNDYTGLAESAAAINRDFYTYNKDVKNINDSVKNINLANQNFIPIIPKLKELIISLPDDIKINSLQIDRRAQILVLNGTALTRNALLHYQDVLNKMSWISKVETPASQLFQKDNVNFEFKAQLKNLTLKGDTKVTPKKPAGTDEI